MKNKIFILFVTGCCFFVFFSLPCSGAKNPSCGAMERVNSPTYFVDSGPLPESIKMLSYGGALNLKYHSGISYEHLQAKLPGRTISVSVRIPPSSISPFGPAPNKLRALIKSETNGSWATYSSEEWFSVKKEGVYDLKVTVPDKPVQTRDSGIFYPENTILFAVEYYVVEGNQRLSRVSFEISDFKIEGVSIDPKKVKWQFMKNGYTINDEFLPVFPAGSALLGSIGSEIDLDLGMIAPPEDSLSFSSHDMKRDFLSLSLSIPEELRSSKGSAELRVKDNKGTMRTASSTLNSCDRKGDLSLSIPLDVFTYDQDLAASLVIRSREPHTDSMLPFVLGPLEIKEGALIPWDKEWTIRDIHGLGGYKKLVQREDGVILPRSVTITKVGDDIYRTELSLAMKGGTDWKKNPYYRVELLRALGKSPQNMKNTRLEVLITPLTDTTDLWQKPYRARLGLLDKNDNVMFGPNISLSEGLSNLAYLDVSTSAPVPKGFVMSGFDPEQVKAVIINLEASPLAEEKPRDIRLSLSDLRLIHREYPGPDTPKAIDFSCFKRDPSLWRITGMVKAHLGFDIGMNLPFPSVDVAKTVMAVPQVYPSVGMKGHDPAHLGFSSPITRSAVIRDCEKMASNGIDLVRFMALGHLEGVFTWDENGKAIEGFSEIQNKMLEDSSSPGIAALAAFLRTNEETLFPKNEKGAIPGLNEYVPSDLTAFLDILEEVEKRTGQRVMAVLSLYDFTLGDGITHEGPLRAYEVGEHPEIVLDRTTKLHAEAILWKTMKDLAKDERFYKYIAAVEIMNEPENAATLATPENFTKLVDFLGENLYLLKDALGPEMPLSVGFRSWAEDLRYWAPIGPGLDILMIHYWERFESYDIDKPGSWPLDKDVAELWEYLGTHPEGRLTGIGEIDPSEDLKMNLARLKKAGYDFALIWSYSGHDGFDAKPYLDMIKEVQKKSLRSS